VPGEARGRGQRGMVLMEVLASLLLSAFLVGALLHGAGGVHGCVSRWDRSMRMRQALMASWLQMSRDLRMAGCDPWESGRVEGLETDPVSGPGGGAFTLHADRRGRAPDSWPDGDGDDPDERITYRLDVGGGVLRRNQQPVLLGCVEGPGAGPFVSIERHGEAGLVRVALRVGEGEDERSLAASVCVRNPL